MSTFRYKNTRAQLIVPSYWSFSIYLIRRRLIGQDVSLLPPLPEGRRLHIGAGQNVLEGY